MMQSNIVQRASQQLKLSIISSTCQALQVRNHSKIYPWRFNRSNRECYLDTTKTPYTDRHNINEFINHKRKKKDWQLVVPKDKDNRFNAYKWNDAYKSDPKEAKETARSKLHRLQDSLRDRGAARESIAYNPPEDVQERVLGLYKDMCLESGAQESTEISPASSAEDILAIDLNQSRTLKFNLITNCINAFGHHMPTSHLTECQYIRDVVEYYSTPVRGINPYSALLRQEEKLPINLALCPEPLRFDAATDEYFKYNALPGLICKVPGLRASVKFPTLNQDEFQWPDV